VWIITIFVQAVSVTLNVHDCFLHVRSQLLSVLQLQFNLFDYWDYALQLPIGAVRHGFGRALTAGQVILLGQKLLSVASYDDTMGRAVDNLRLFLILPSVVARWLPLFYLLLLGTRG
jgi:hypothetical protein